VHALPRISLTLATIQDLVNPFEHELASGRVVEAT